MTTHDREARARLFLDEMRLGPVWVPRDRGPREVAAETSLLELEDFKRLPDPTGSFAETDLAQHASPAQRSVPGTGNIELDAYAPERIAQMTWVELKDTVSGCVKCRLCQGRTKTVFGAGDEKATWLFIGEGPGRNEDQQGEPFIGPAGRLLDNMMEALGIRRGENAYIANIVKCRPTDSNGRDRAPTADEAAACLPYLERQIALIKPTVLVALGKTAAIALLGLDADTPVGSLRGTVHRHGDLPLVVTYHPAYLLRKLGDKGKVWSDLCLAADAHDGHIRASA